MTQTKKLVTLLVEVNKRPTNEIEGDGWQPSDRYVAAEIQQVMGRYDTDDGYEYGMVQTYPYLSDPDWGKVLGLLEQVADSRERRPGERQREAGRLAALLREQLL
jgi:hypothetical protein